MRLLQCLIFSASLLLVAPNLVYARAPELDAYRVVENWADALDHKDVNRIVSNYAESPNVLFFGTKSTILATTKAEIKDYFTHFVEAAQPAGAMPCLKSQ